MRFLLIILFPFLLSAQFKLPEKLRPYDQAIDVYSTMIVNDAMWHLMDVCKPTMKGRNKMLFAVGLTIVYIGVSNKIEYGKFVNKEFYNTDQGLKCWGICLYQPVRITINDCKKQSDRYEIKYYYFDNLGIPTCN